MKPMTAGQARKQSAADELNAKIADLAARATMNDWNAFVRELPVPHDLMLALMTARPELIRLVQPREYSAKEMMAMFELVAGLLETNAALREHAQQVSHLVSNWASAFDQLRSIGEKIELFANFQHDQIERDDDHA